MNDRSETQYEYAERVAMRMEAGCDLATADHLARVDLSHRPEEDEQMAALRAGSQIDRLRLERERIRQLWQREIDPLRNRELREQWMNLSIEIAKLKCKESDHVYDGRVSG